MKRVAIPVVLLAVLAAAWWVFSRSSPRAPESLAPPAPLAIETSNEPVVIADETQVATRMQAVEPVPAAGNPVAPPRESTATTLRPGEAELAIRVLSQEEHQPVQGVRVFLSEDPPPKHFSAQHIEGSLAKLGESPLTDESGAARFVLASGRAHKVTVFGSDRIGQIAAAVPALAEGEHRTVVLEGPTRDDRRFFGRLIAAENESPIREARIELVAPGGVSVKDKGELQPSGLLLAELDKVERATTTDREGLFEFSFASWRPVYARVVEPGWSMLLTGLPQGHETAEHALLLRLERSGSVDVNVLDAKQTPVEGIQIRLSAKHYLLGPHGADWFGGGDPAWAAATDVGGRCRLAEIPVRVPLTLEVVQDRKVVRRDVDTFELAPGEAKQVELVLGGGARLRGRAIDQDGRPVASREVWLKRADPRSVRRAFMEHEEVAAKAKTDAEGAFLFEDVAVGDWLVGLAPRPSYGAKTRMEEDYASLAQRVSALAGRDVDVLVRADRGLLVRGRVLDAQGKEAVEGLVSASGPAFVNRQIDEHGEFALGPLPAGEYRITARAPFGKTDADSEPTLALAGTAGMLLKFRPGGSLSGRVVDSASGKGCEAKLTFARFGVARDAHEFYLGASMTESQEDRFEFHGELPGEYRISARTSDGKYGSSVVSIEAGKMTEDVEIAVEPGARLRVRCEGDHGHGSFFLVHDQARIAFDGIRAGSMLEYPVPPGLISVLSHVSGASLTEQQITLAKGETREVVVQPYQ